MDNWYSNLRSAWRSLHGSKAGAKRDGVIGLDSKEAIASAAWGPDGLDRAHFHIATPATLAGQFRARVLREAADVLDARGETTRYPSQLGPSEWNPGGTVLTEAGAAWCDAARRLRALADEAERAK